MSHVRCFGIGNQTDHGRIPFLRVIEETVHCGADFVVARVEVIDGGLAVVGCSISPQSEMALESTSFKTTEFPEVCQEDRMPQAIPFADVVNVLERRASLAVVITGVFSASRVVREIQNAVFRGIWRYGNFMVCSADFGALQLVKSYDPGVNIGCMILSVPHFATRYAERLGAQCVFLNKTQTTADLVSECHCRGLEIVAHVINSEPEYLLMETLGVASVVSDVPRKILSWRMPQSNGLHSPRTLLLG
jgi:hypothetical protein